MEVVTQVEHVEATEEFCGHWATVDHVLAEAGEMTPEDVAAVLGCDPSDLVRVPFARLGFVLFKRVPAFVELVGPVAGADEPMPSD